MPRYCAPYRFLVELGYSLFLLSIFLTSHSTNAQMGLHGDVFLSEDFTLVIHAPSVHFVEGRVQALATSAAVYLSPQTEWEDAGPQKHFDARIATSGKTDFTFPLGHAATYHPLVIHQSGGAAVSARFVFNPHTASDFETDLEAIAPFYWDIDSAAHFDISLTWNTPFGNNTAPIRLGDGSQTASITVGSRYGHTGLYGSFIVLTSGQGGSHRFAQLGFTTTDQGSTYTVSGTLTLRAKQDLRLVGGGDANTFNYAQVRHVGADTVSDSTVEATVTAPIDCAVGSEVYLSGGTPLSNYTQLRHVGYNAVGIYNEIYILHTPEVSIQLI